MNVSYHGQARPAACKPGRPVSRNLIPSNPLSATRCLSATTPHSLQARPPRPAPPPTDFGPDFFGSRVPQSGSPGPETRKSGARNPGNPLRERSCMVGGGRREGRGGEGGRSITFCTLAWEQPRVLVLGLRAWFGSRCHHESLYKSHRIIRPCGE